MANIINSPATAAVRQRTKTLLYCQHSIGMGHLVRTLRLAEACLANGPVRLICGGQLPPKLRIHPDIGVDALPPLIVGPSGKLIDPHEKTDTGIVLGHRREQAVAAARAFKADVLVVEMFPFGRKKFADEVLAIIAAVREQSRSRVISSVRDVLVTTRRDQQRHDQRAVDCLNRHFDAVLIHADPKLVSLDETFSTFSQIRIPVHYTGYVCSGRMTANGLHEPLVVVSAGGGRVGERLIEVASDSFPALKKAFGLDMLLITGPFSKPRPATGEEKQGLKKVPFINDLPSVIGRASLSISQCGYNTATDILRARIPAVFVPYETPSENEQLRRADLLAAGGRSVTLREKNLTPATLLNTVRQALETTNHKRLKVSVDLDGARCSSDIINKEWIGHA